MITEKRLLSSLTPNTKNVRRHNENQIKELWKSVQKFGQIRPIVIDDDGVILCGHGLYQAYLFGGQEEADVIIMRGLSDKDKKKLLLADNKIYSLGIDNYNAIEELLQELANDSDFDVPGYDADILESMYGISSIKDESIPKMPSQATESPAVPSEPDISPSTHKRIEQAREEAVNKAEKFIICPSCGEKIYL